jgi:ANTAR domain
MKPSTQTAELTTLAPPPRSFGRVRTVGNGARCAPGTADSAAVASVPAGTNIIDVSHRSAGLHAQAQATREQSQALAARLRAAQHATAETVRLITAALDRVEQIQELRIAARADRLQYSPHARLQARLASMPVIEQAKGIIMAQCRCSEDQAFDALRKASQRENIKLRDLAARVVAKTAGPASK